MRGCFEGMIESGNINLSNFYSHIIPIGNYCEAFYFFFLFSDGIILTGFQKLVTLINNKDSNAYR